MLSQALGFSPTNCPPSLVQTVSLISARGKVEKTVRGMICIAVSMISTIGG